VIGEGPVIGHVQRELFENDLRDEWELKKPCPLQPLDCAYDLLSGLFL